MCFGTTLMMRTHSRLESSLSGVGGLLAGGCRTIVEQCADDLLRLDDDALNDSRRLGSGGGGDSRFKGINMASSALTLCYVLLSTHAALLGRATRSVVHTLIVMHALLCADKITWGSQRSCQVVRTLTGTTPQPHRVNGL